MREWRYKSPLAIKRTLSRLSSPSRPAEPRWHESTTLDLRPPQQVRDWLEDEGSLTRRLRLRCGPEFHVVLQPLKNARPLASERKSLGMAPQALALVREVKLCCGDSSWVYARSLIPLQSLQGAGRRLRFLGNRPLGSLLFSDPKATRGPMEFARLLPGHCLYEKAVGQRQERPALLWGRRTLFFFAGKPLLVNEVFLNGIGIY